MRRNTQSKFTVIPLIISLVTIIGSASVADAKSPSSKSKPTTPAISTISASRKITNNKLDITVRVNPGKTHRSAPLLQSEVRIGKYKCIAKKKAKTCVAKGVPQGKTYQISVRSRNKNGYSRWSDRIRFTATKGSRWNRTDGEPANNSNAALRFNFKGVVGVTQRSSVTSTSVRKASTGSNLLTVNSAGILADAVTSGSATINKFLIAPNDKLYVVFSTPTDIDKTKCLLAEIARETGIPTCIDNELNSIYWPNSQTEWSFTPIQFDDTGTIYYSGSDRVGKSVLRKFSNGTITSLITDNTQNISFLVLPDGRVLVGGSTSSTNSQWTRLINSSGGLQTLVSGSQPRFLARFPDNNVYMGFWGGDNNNMGVRRFLSSTSSIDSTYWISGNVNSVERPAFFHVDNARNSENEIEALEGFYGTGIQRLITTSDGKVFVVTAGKLVQYYPNVAKTTSTVTSVGVAQGILTYVVMSGTNVSGQNVTVLYNTANDTEQVLIPPTNEIEVYHLNFVASENKIMFDGLRFADNKYVIGQIDLNTMQVTSSQTGSSRLVDFQTFGR